METARVLGDIVESLDAEVLRVASMPRQGSAAVSDVVIVDFTDPHGVQPDAILLAVGVPPESGDALALVDGAGRRGAAAVVFRADGELPERLLEMADSLGVALLGVPPEMAWGQAYSLLRTAIASAGGDEWGEAAGIPLGDLFGLADAIASAVGGPVTIEDAQMRVLAYSNLDQPIDEARRQTILGRTPPLVWQRRLEEAGVTQSLRSGELVRYEAPGLARRLAAPVRAGGELLGAVWVAEAGAPLGAAAEQELIRIAEHAGIHLISHRASEDLKRRTRGAYMREVLAGRLPRGGGEAPSCPGGPFTVLAFEPAEGEPPSRRADANRILGIVALYSEDEHRDALCAIVDERFWALLPTPERRPRERLLELGEKIVGRVEQSLHVPVRVGIGVSVPSVSDVPRSRRAAERALEVLAEREPPGVIAHFEDVGAHAVLLELAELLGDHPALRQGKLQRLIEHDERHGSGYTATLRAYFDAGGDSALAAARLGLHSNSVRYRLRRLGDLSGLDLEDPEERFVTELQLRLSDGNLPLS